MITYKQHRSPRKGGIKARVHLSDEIARCVKAGAVRLPTITEMAVAAQVSRGAMHRAVLELQSQGVLQARHRGGITLTGAATQVPQRSIAIPPETLSPRFSLSLTRLRQRIERDIIQGRYRTTGILPGAKELTASYGASYPTIRKALMTMASDGSVEQWKRGFRLMSHPAPESRNKIVLVVRGIDGSNSSDTIGAWAPRNSEQYQALALECGRTNLDIDFAIYRFVDGVLVGPDGGRRFSFAPRKKDRTLGFMLWTQGLTKLDLPEFVSDLTRHQLPVALLDVTGANDFRPLLQAGSLVRLFPLGITPYCGTAMGRYLRGLGHEHIAYFSLSEDDSHRLNGIRSAYAVSAQPGAVRYFRIPNTGGSTPTRDHFRSVVRGGARRGQHADTEYTRMATRHREQLISMYSDERAYSRADEVFSAALADPKVTAWVAETDATAIRCLEFLRSRGVDVPGRISLVGFDDTEQAFLRGLTSYNFNLPAIIHSMVDHLLHPRPLRPGARDELQTRIEGFVNVRKTTTRPGPSDDTR